MRSKSFFSYEDPPMRPAKKKKKNQSRANQDHVNQEVRKPFSCWRVRDGTNSQGRLLRQADCCGAAAESELPGEVKVQMGSDEGVGRADWQKQPENYLFYFFFFI